MDELSSFGLNEVPREISPAPSPLKPPRVLNKHRSLGSHDETHIVDNRNDFSKRNEIVGEIGIRNEVMLKTNQVRRTRKYFLLDMMADECDERNLF